MPTPTPDPTEVFGWAAIVIAVLFFVTYFIPLFIALVRQKAEGLVGLIFVNLFLGWTAIGWIIAFVMAFTGKTTAELQREQQQHQELLAALARRT